MNMGSMMGIGGGQMPDFSAMREKLFQKSDSNGDQALSLQKFQETGKNMPMGKGMSADKAKEAFARIDSDGNGSLSKDEMRSFGDKMSSQMQSAMINIQAMMGGQQGGGMMGGMPDPSAMFGKADGDKDGTISRAEFDEAGKNSPMASMMGGTNADDIFASIDGDGDGSLSEEEMSAFGGEIKEKMKGMMGAMGANQPSDFTKAMNAYKQGSNDSTDLTSILLKALDGNKDSASARGKTA